MQEILSNIIQQYIEYGTSKVSTHLNALERETHLKVLRSHMISGPYQAQLIQMICKMCGVKKALELGTFTGYISIAMAEVLDGYPCVHTIEGDPELANFALTQFEKYGYSQNIQLYNSQIEDLLDRLLNLYDFDLAFIDADKKNNNLYYDKIVSSIKSGGIIIIDNVLWKGLVLEEVKDATTQAIHNFNNYIAKDHRVDVIMLPIRDGLSIARKK